MLLKVVHVSVIKGRLTPEAITMPVTFTNDIKHKLFITIKNVEKQVNDFFAAAAFFLFYLRNPLNHVLEKFFEQTNLFLV